MDLIKSYYPKNIKIKYIEKTLTLNLRNNLEEEFEDKQFVKDEINQLLKAPTYHCFSYANIELNIIPFKNASFSLFKKVIKRIYTLTQIYNISQPITIWLIPTQSKRQFPKNGEKIQAQHINGGYTYMHNSTIYVYRLEEFPKVILHEVLHNSILQISWSQINLMELYDLFNIDKSSCEENSMCKTRLQPEEAIIEVWALYYQIMFQAYETNKDCLKLFYTELEWSLYQCKKLLEYHKLYYDKGWEEDTHAYSYIFLKTLFLYYWSDFSKIKIPYTDVKIMKFIKIHMKKPKRLLKAIENSKNFDTQSFRMTYLGDL